MREVVLLQSDVSVPTTTSGQHAIAAFVTVVLLIFAIVAYRRSKVFGLDAEHRDIREDARAQCRRRTPAELKLSVDTVEDLTSAELRQRLLALFEADAEQTITRVPAAAKRVTGALSEAWGNRVGWLPALARRAVGLAGMVVVLGAVAVSGEAVVALLRTDPSAPGPGSVIDTVTNGARAAVDVIGAYPYAGTLWELAYAGVILAVQWLYQQWALIAAVLVLAAVSIVLLDYRLDDEAVPDRMIQSRRLAGGIVLVGIVGIWAAGVAPVVLASTVESPMLAGLAVVPLLIALGCATIAWILKQGRVYRVLQFLGAGFALASGGGSSWASIAGVWSSILVAGVLTAAIGPRAVRRLRRGIGRVAGSDARPAAALLIIQRVLATLSIVAGVLTVAYAVAGVANGQWRAVLAAAVRAAPEVQLLLGAATMAVLGLTVYSLREAWPTAREELRAAYAQQAVRAKVLGRGVPWLGVFFSYVFFAMLFGSIPIALVLAVVVGVVLRYGLWLADEAEYRADGQAILRSLFRSRPSMIVARAVVLDVDGREVYHLDINGEEFVHDDREELVDDVVQYVEAAVERESKPRVDSREFADYLLKFGIADSEDWGHKLDEVIRKTALKPFRNTRVPIIGSSRRRIRRAKFDALLEDFDNDRVRQRLREDDLYRCLDVNEQWVTLERDPYSVEQRDQDWPALSD